MESLWKKLEQYVEEKQLNRKVLSEFEEYTFSTPDAPAYYYIDEIIDNCIPISNDDLIKWLGENPEIFECYMNKHLNECFPYKLFECISGAIGEDLANDTYDKDKHYVVAVMLTYLASRNYVYDESNVDKLIMYVTNNLEDTSLNKIKEFVKELQWKRKIQGI